jgi:hypothetical protein
MAVSIRDGNGFRPLTAERLAAFEREFGTPLPEDYRAFLLRHNGGVPDRRPSTSPARTAEEGDERPFHCFFALHDGPWDDSTPEGSQAFLQAALAGFRAGGGPPGASPQRPQKAQRGGGSPLQGHDQTVPYGDDTDLPDRHGSEGSPDLRDRFHLRNLRNLRFGPENLPPKQPSPTSEPLPFPLRPLSASSAKSAVTTHRRPRPPGEPGRLRPPGAIAVPGFCNMGYRTLTGGLSRMVDWR